MKTVIFLLCLFVSGIANAQETTTVTVKVDNMTNDKGQLVLGLYQKDNFLKGMPKFGDIVPIENGKATVVLNGIPAGTYAISCFQDENNNKQLDRNANGYPTENYGLSNNPGKGGYPEFEKAKFRVGSKPVKLHIKM